MSDEPDVRIGTPEREAAQQQLNEHFSLGRLDVAEFEERSTTVSGARTRGELDAVFHDLPAVSATTEQATVDKSRRPWRYSVIGVMPIIAVVLFFVLQGVWGQSWLVFLLIPVAGALLGGGEYRDRDRRRRQRRTDRRRD